MLLKTLYYGMRSQIKVDYSQETKGSDKADDAVSWLCFWSEMCIKTLSYCGYCQRQREAVLCQCPLILDVTRAGFLGEDTSPLTVMNWELRNRNLAGKNLIFKGMHEFVSVSARHKGFVTCTEPDLPQWNSP